MEEDLFNQTKEVSQDSLKQLSKFCATYKDLEQDIEHLEEKIKLKKQDLENIARVQIPTILNEVGISDIKLSTGERILVEDKLMASIPEKNYMSAYRNMIKAEGGDESAESKIDSLFKSKAIIEDVSDKALEVLLSNDIPYELNRNSHWMTLRKYCKERLDNGKEIPEGISVFQYQEAKIK